MITIQDIKEAIAEYEGKRNPTRDTCLYLAAFYILQDRLSADQNDAPQEIPQYSRSNEVKIENVIYSEGDSDFLKAVDGMKAERLLEILDELMDSLSVLNPRLYDGVMRRIVE